MKKQDAIAIFGSITAMAKALEISRQAIHNMPEQLSRGQEDRFYGACYRLGIEVPSSQDQSEAKWKGQAAPTVYKDS